MKKLALRLSIGAMIIAFTFALARLERGHIAFGAEVLIATIVLSWMAYQIYLFYKELTKLEKQWAKRGEHIRKLHTRIKNKDKFISCLKETVIASNKQTIKLEHENKMLRERERFLESKLEQIDQLFAKTEQMSNKTEQSESESGRTNINPQMIAG